LAIGSDDRAIDSGAVAVPERVTILGGGIGGLTLANALQRVGIDFDVYEQAPELTEVGAGIGLTTGVMELFDGLGIGDELRDVGTPVRYVCLTDKHLKSRRRLESPNEAICIHRATLIDALKRRLPTDRIHLSNRAVDVQSHPDRVEVTFAHGTVITTPCLVAADGINSVIRSRLVPDIRTRFIDQAIWRGRTPGALEDPFTESYIEIWDERLRFLTVPYGIDVFWLAVKPAPPGERDDPATVKMEIIDTFRNFHPRLKNLVRNTEGPILRNDMADLGTAPRSWHHNRVVFLGDAIHATTPNLAQGGCQAIEDGVCLALSLDAHRDDLARAFTTYQRLRQPKASSIVRTSWRLGKAAHTRNPIPHYFFRFILERAPASLLLKQERTLSDLSYLDAVDKRAIIRPAAAS